jgi:hypothetical protein
LEVSVQGKVDDTDWVGIGFSLDNAMVKIYSYIVKKNPTLQDIFIFQPETDIVVGFFDKDGNGIVQDYYTTGYSPPELDDSQDISETSIERKDGVTTIRFKRSLETSDTKVV